LTRILISRLSAHGDIIQTLPLLNTLRTSYPQAFIGWLVEPAGLPLLQHHPQLDAVHTLPLKAIKQALKQGQLKTAWQLVDQSLKPIRQAGYTISLDPQGLLKSAVPPWLAGIRHRVGFEQTREQASWFYTHKMPPHDMQNPHKRTIDWFNELAMATGLLTLLPPQPVLPPVPPHVEAHITNQLAPISLQAGPVIALAPGTIWPSKQWPYWPRLMGLLQHHNILLLGSPAEGDMVQGWVSQVFPHGLPAHWQNWVGQTDWHQLQALLQRVDVLIGPDSAPLHLANAVGWHTGKPRLLGLYGPTAPGRTGPTGSQHSTLTTQLPCQPCFKRRCPLKGLDHMACLTGLTPDLVMTQLERWGL
jgi:heptosyltransferase I